MRNDIYYATLERIYRHFVIEQNPPGVIDGFIRYHHGSSGDAVDVDCPCAIGLLDDQYQLSEPPLADLSVIELRDEHPEVLAALLNVDGIDDADADFLDLIQSKHDYHAAEAHRKRWRPIETFRREMADALEGIARVYGLPKLSF